MFINLGSNRALAALVELKRPRPAGQQAPGYSRSDALAGIGPRPGSVHMLENDRVRVYETTLEPGQSDEMRAQLDAAVYVIEGGKIRLSKSAMMVAGVNPSRSTPTSAAVFCPAASAVNSSM